jgi:hypothetical protein
MARWRSIAILVGLVVSGVATAQTPAPKSAAPALAIPSPAPPSTTAPVVAPAHMPAETYYYVPGDAAPCLEKERRVGPLQRLAMQPRHTGNCLGCGTFWTESRFVWGSCRAFFGEGRYVLPPKRCCPD